MQYVKHAFFHSCRPNDNFCILKFHRLSPFPQFSLHFVYTELIHFPKCARTYHDFTSWLTQFSVPGKVSRLVSRLLVNTPSPHYTLAVCSTPPLCVCITEAITYFIAIRTCMGSYLVQSLEGWEPVLSPPLSLQNPVGCI